MTVLPKIKVPPKRPQIDLSTPGGGKAIIYGIQKAPHPGWHHVILDGKTIAVNYCPKCLKRGDLDEHQIAEDGTVTPSVVCPHEPCDFHDHVRLEGWEP